MDLKLLRIPVGSMKNFTYVVGDADTGEALVIDPSWDLDRVLEDVRESGMKVVAVANTHRHSDHTRGNDEVVAKTGAKIYAHEMNPVRKDAALVDGDVIRVGSLKVRVIHTPGHTLDSICLLVEKKLFTGDTLFVGDCGRTDLEGGSPEEMYHSFFDKILKLEDDVEVYPGHDYGDRPSSTLGWEKMTNYTLKRRSKEEFVRFMREP